jgi:hypothetical protein
LSSSSSSTSSSDIDHSTMETNDLFFAEDPLDWLVDGGINHLPDGSLLMLPDSTVACSPPPFPDLKNNTGFQDVHLNPSHKSDDMASDFCSLLTSDAALSGIVDPMVTLHSLIQ